MVTYSEKDTEKKRDKQCMEVERIRMERREQQAVLEMMTQTHKVCIQTQNFIFKYNRMIVPNRKNSSHSVHEEITLKRNAPGHGCRQQGDKRKSQRVKYCWESKSTAL